MPQPQPPKLVDQDRHALRVKHYSRCPKSIDGGRVGVAHKVNSFQLQGYRMEYGFYRREPGLS